MTTILSVRKGNCVVMAGDGQVSMQNTIMKPSARKLRNTFDGKVIAGFAVPQQMLSHCSKNLMKNLSSTMENCCALQLNWPKNGELTKCCVTWRHCLLFQVQKPHL